MLTSLAFTVAPVSSVYWQLPLTSLQLNVIEAFPDASQVALALTLAETQAGAADTPPTSFDQFTSFPPNTFLGCETVTATAINIPVNIIPVITIVFLII